MKLRCFYPYLAVITVVWASPAFADSHQILGTYLDTGNPGTILHKGKTLLETTTVTCPSTASSCTFVLHATDTIDAAGGFRWKIVMTVDGVVVDEGTPENTGDVKPSTGCATHLAPVIPGDHTVNLYTDVSGNFDIPQRRWVVEYTVTTP